MEQKPYPIVLFDWGDTVMYDDPLLTVPMSEWDAVRAVEGVAEVLADLQASGRQVMLATAAAISDEAQIRKALARAGLDVYFSRIYCFKNTGLPKGEAFYRHILADLKVSAADALMIGDSFEKDVQIPNALGVFAVWFNQRSGENRNNELHTTVHSMSDLRTFFRAFGI
ncbi:MAG: HAD family hydrolase [Chloroflexi bacterium]|nr:HAD family hydrolase [Chloroflexota bacterium]